ncbi:MAG: hypothetical protein K2X47_07130, partial [Bdellovibrionales bacterium]|nr:hypothetical protein [Bdellovibrionales bacterium]
MVAENRFLRIIKTIVGAPVPYLLAGYTISLLSSMAGMEILGWLTATLTLIYILVDRLTSEHEFKFFWMGPDIFLVGFCISAAVGLALNAPEVDFWMALGKFRWIVLLYLLTYAMDLFPPLNRLLTILMGGGALVAAYAIFQHFTGVDFRYEFGLRSESAVTP